MLTLHTLSEQVQATTFSSLSQLESISKTDPQTSANLEKQVPLISSADTHFEWGNRPLAKAI